MSKIYSTKDTTVGFVDAFMATNNAVAKRLFGEAVNQKGTMLNKYPDDYELYAIAEFDEDNGVVKGFEAPEQIARAKDMIKKEEDSVKAL